MVPDLPGRTGVVRCSQVNRFRCRAAIRSGIGRWLVSSVNFRMLSNLSQDQMCKSSSQK